MKRILLSLALTLSLPAFAGPTRVLDGQAITNGSATITLPTTTDTLVGRGTTDTLTNKTLTAPAITAPTGLVKADVGLANVDNTSDTAKNSATATLTNKTISGAANTLSNVPAAALTGTVPLANGGTGSSTQSGAANAILPSQTSQASKVLTTDGTNASWSSIPTTAPSVTGSTGTPTSVTAAGGITFSSSVYANFNFIQGSPGAVTVSANPQVAAGSLVGQRLILIGRSATNTVTLADGNGISLNGTWVGGLQSIITLVWDGTVWTEESRR